MVHSTNHRLWLEVGGEDFYLDLLFYHLQLRCYVAIDLKIGEFKPEYSGKMSFYVSAVDDLLRHPDDRQTIGLILCKSRNQTIAEYALRDVNKPISIARYQRYQQELPEELRAVLPSVAQLEVALGEIGEMVNGTDSAEVGGGGDSAKPTLGDR